MPRKSSPRYIAQGCLVIDSKTGKPKGKAILTPQEAIEKAAILSEEHRNRFKKILNSYQTYNPDIDGRGNVNSWRQAFNATMGKEEAVAVLQADEPLVVLGLTVMPATINDLKKVYRALMLKVHPDAGGDEDSCKKVIAAYTVLEEKFTVKK